MVPPGPSPPPSLEVPEGEGFLPSGPPAKDSSLRRRPPAPAVTAPAVTAPATATAEAEGLSTKIFCRWLKTLALLLKSLLMSR